MNLFKDIHKSLRCIGGRWNINHHGHRGSAHMSIASSQVSFVINTLAKKL